MDGIKKYDKVFLDLETTVEKNILDNKITVIQIKVGKAIIICDNEKYFKALLKACETKLVIGHNIKFDAKMAYMNYGIKFKKLYCTLVAHRLVRFGEKSGNSFSDLVNSLQKDVYISKEMQTSFEGGSLDFEQLYYAINDVYFMPLLKGNVDYLIKFHQLEKAEKIEMLLIPILVESECKGVKVDLPYFKNLISKWGKDYSDTHEDVLKEYEKFEGHRKHPEGKTERKRINGIVKDIELPFNPSSHTQINTFVQKFSNFPVNEEGSPTTDSRFVIPWIEKNDKAQLRPFYEKLIKYKKASKLYSTYGIGLKKKLRKNRIHTTYHSNYTNTARFSSRNPNIQNIPATKAARKIFIPDDGYVFFDFDWEGQETIIAAAYSKDPLLLSTVLEGKDFHSFIASKAFEKILKRPTPIIAKRNGSGEKEYYIGDKKSITLKTKKGDSVTFSGEELRTISKAPNFAYFYGAMGKKLFESYFDVASLFWDKSEYSHLAKEIYKAYNEALPELTKYLKQKVIEYETKGYIRSSPVIGRKHSFINGGYNDVMNCPIQATGAEAMKLAIIYVDKILKKYEAGYLAITVHDQAVWAIKKEKLTIVRPLIEEACKKALTVLTGIPCKITVNVLNHWTK